MKKRLLALLLCITISFNPAMAYAEETGAATVTAEEVIEDISFETATDTTDVSDETVIDGVSQNDIAPENETETEDTAEDSETEEDADTEESETEEDTESEDDEDAGTTIDYSFMANGDPNFYDPYGNYGIPGTEETISNSKYRNDCLSADATVSYPVKYDPRGTSVSSVKDQFGGTCWAYATIASVESNLIKKGYADTSIDLSELSTMYFTLSGRYSDPLGYYTDELKTSNDSMYQMVWGGGYSENALAMFSRWKGLAKETDASFKGYDAYDKDAVNSITVNSTVADKNYWHLSNTRYCDYYEGGVPDDNPAIENVKELITTYGGVSCSYYNSNDPAYLKQIESKDYKTYVGNSAFINEPQYDIVYYYPMAHTTNHAVEIVGWDDNYPASNFGRNPGKNGAWLVKQSWGGGENTETTTAIFNGLVETGYMWLSYYDKSLKNIRAVEMDSASRYANTYSFVWSNNNNFKNEDSTKRTSIFTAKAYTSGAEKIDAVMAELYKDLNYSITVYVNPKFVDGELVAYSGKSGTVTGSSTYTGYYTIPMSSPAYITEGDTFAVICETDDENEIGCTNIKALTNKADGVIFSTSVTPSKTSIALTDKASTTTIYGTVYPANATNRTCGYYSSDYDVVTVDTNGGVKAKKYGKANIEILSYDGESKVTVPVTVACTSMSLDNTTISLGQSKTLTPKTTLEGLNSSKLTYTSSNPSVISVTNDGTVTSNALGSATITAKYVNEAGNTITAICTVTSATPVSSIACADTTVCVGQSVQLNPTVLPTNAGDKNLSYSSSDDSVVVSATGLVTAKSVPAGGFVTITITAKDRGTVNTKVTVYVTEGISNIADSGCPSTLNVNETKDVFLKVTSSDNSWSKHLAVSSSNPSVVSVSDVNTGSWGEYNAGFAVTGAGNGTATITLKTTDGSNITKTWNVTVSGGNNIGNSNTGSTQPTPQPQPDPQPVQPQNNTPAYYNGTVTVGAYTYVLNNGTAALKSVSKKTKKVTVPANVVYNGLAYPVTEVKSSACKGLKNLTSVTIGVNVTKIGSKAFYNCPKLKTVTIKATGLKSVGSSAFKKIKENATIKVPKAKKKAYTKLLKKKCDSSAKIK